MLQNDIKLRPRPGPGLRAQGPSPSATWSLSFYLRNFFRQQYPLAQEITIQNAVKCHKMI